VLCQRIETDIDISLIGRLAVISLLAADSAGYRRLNTPPAHSIARIANVGNFTFLNLLRAAMRSKVFRSSSLSQLSDISRLSRSSQKDNLHGETLV
jgi:hypothetical protein